MELKERIEEGNGGGGGYISTLKKGMLSDLGIKIHDWEKSGKNLETLIFKSLNLKI